MFAPDGLQNQYMHLGAAYIVPESQKDLLIELWRNFDNAKKTAVSNSVERILNYRFP
jgi:hypothetical protein